MTEPLRPATADCLSCGREFAPRKLGHVFCSRDCRYAGPGQRVHRDSEAVERLFDPERDPSERVRDDDWHPTPDSGLHELDLWDTLADRRRWFKNLVHERVL